VIMACFHDISCFFPRLAARSIAHDIFSITREAEAWESLVCPATIL